MNDSLAIPKANITRLLTPMEIPAMRRNLDKPENIHWLIRNLGINNSSHQDYKETMSQLSLVSKIISFKALVARRMSDVLLPRWNDTLIYPQLDLKDLSKRQKMKLPNVWHPEFSRFESLVIAAEVTASAI